MELEFGIEDLLNKRRIESDRIEFKTGWNPDDIYRSVCAYANDYDNQGGGYIVVGVKEVNGIAVRPVVGVDEDKLDQIQKDMLGYNRKLIPAYFPKTIIEKVDGRYVVVLWVPTSEMRPHKGPEHVTVKKDGMLKYFIRYNSNSTVATSDQERELIEMSSRVPFDMRPNPDATMDDISLVLLEEHLKTTGSKLAKELRNLGAEAVLQQMQLLAGPPENLKLRNVALMMFCEEPDRFFPYTEVDIVKFPNGSVKDPNNFIEVPAIKGSVPTIIRRTMEKLQDMVIEDKVTKVPYQMEAIRRFSYPYQALEEAVVNAFYHRDYLSYEPVHVEIEPECIHIISYPGIDRSISMNDIEKGERFRTRMYRNRRLGEFLKELDLSEGHCTGIPTIQDELEKNGSPRAVFRTDEDRRAVEVEIPIHPDFLKKANDDLQKANDGIKKANDDVENANMEELKDEYIERLKQAGSNKTTIGKMLKLFEEMQLIKTFGRKEVVLTIGGGNTAASRLIKRLLETGITEAVDERGNGKYHFCDIHR